MEPAPEPEPEPEPERLPEFELQFVEAGPLGLILASTGGESGRVRLVGITPGTQAENHDLAAAVGAVLAKLRVGDAEQQDVVALPYLECVELLKTKVRPLAFVFEVECGSLPPPICDASAAAAGAAAQPSPTGGAGAGAESGMATLRRVVSRALTRSSIDEGVLETTPTPAVADLVAVDDISGLTWTTSHPDSLGQLPRVELDMDQGGSGFGAGAGAGAAAGAGAWSPTRTNEADLEKQWKQRERAAHREGYLSQREYGFLARWQRRWFVVNYGVLRVYKDYDQYRKEKQQPDQDATRSSSMRRRSISRQILVSGEDVDDRALDTSLELRDQEAFDFLIRLPMDKTLTLRASNQDDKQAWMHAMQFGRGIKAERDGLAPLVKLVAQHGDVPHALEHPTVCIDDIYCMGELLGAGEIGKVYSAKHRLTDEPVAIKVVDKGKFSARLSAMRRVATREIIVLTTYNMHHPYVVQTRAVIETADWVFIVMELLEGGELQKNIEERHSYTEADAAEVTMRLGLTLGFLHGQGIAHRDVKPGNILCAADHVDIKLADFGFANFSGDTNGDGFKSHVGTPAFMAPEIGDARIKGGYSYAVDVWSTGILLYFMLTGTLPFDHLTHNEMADRRQVLGASALLEETWDHISEGAKDLVRQMLCYDPSGRIDPMHIVSHPWVTEFCMERPELVELMSKGRPPSVKEVHVLEDYDLHNGVLHGLGIVTVDAAKLSAGGALWVGEIPDHLAQGGGRTASDHLKALFEPFGEIVSVTVRTKPGTRKSWAMLSFTTEESATRAIESGVTVDAPEPGMPALRLKLKPAAAKEELQKASTGALGSILKQHASSVLVTESTVWVGCIPSFAVERPDMSVDEQLSSAFGQFGSIVSITVRTKSGTDKSWALITFGELEALSRAVQAAVTMSDLDGQREARLDVRRAEVTMETDGALADISAQHEQEVQNHIVLDVLDISSDSRSSADSPGASDAAAVGASRHGGVGESRQVENTRAKLTDVWQPKNRR